MKPVLLRMMSQEVADTFQFDVNQFCVDFVLNKQLGNDPKYLNNYIHCNYHIGRDSKCWSFYEATHFNAHCAVQP